MSIEILRYTDLGLIDPVGIVGFPSVGLVSSITANYYVTELKMTPVAGLVGSSLPPYALISNGNAYSPIRMYGQKGRTKTARDFIVCTSEYAPKPEDCYEVARSVLLGLRDLGCRDVICLEGIPMTGNEDVPLICGNSPGCAKMMDASGLQKMDNGMVKGISGIMMYEGLVSGVCVSTLLCPATPGMPDPGSAATFVEPLSKMVRGLKVNTKPLMDEAEEIRRRVEEQNNVEKDEVPSTIYG